MESLLSVVVAKMDPLYLFMLILLYGAWKLVNRGLVMFTEHGQKLTDGINSISVDIKGIRSDLSSVVNKLQEHDGRISRLEDK